MSANGENQKTIPKIITMPIPAIPDYNSLMHSGCSLKYANFISRKREYTEAGEYLKIIIPFLSVFDFAVRHYWGTQYNYPVHTVFQHLSVDSDIDYDSFISLN
jgi:hypothetical protein